MAEERLRRAGKMRCDTVAAMCCEWCTSRRWVDLVVTSAVVRGPRGRARTLGWVILATNAAALGPRLGYVGDWEAGERRHPQVYNALTMVRSSPSAA